MALLVGVATAPAAHAGSSNCTGQTQGNYFAGGYYPTWSSAIFGVYARIERVNPDLCGDDNAGPSSSGAWSMVSALSDTSTAPDTNGWAQSGYTQDGTDYPGGLGGILAFSQWTYACKNTTAGCSGDDFKTDYGDAIADDTYYIYRSVLESSDNHIHMYANGVPLAETNYNPAGDWDAAWDYEFFGETAHLGSDVPGVADGTGGVPDDKAQFDRLQYYNSSGNLVDVTSSTLDLPAADSSRYHRETFTPSSGNGTIGVRIWTNPTACSNPCGP